MRILLVANINSSHTKKWALALKNKKIELALFSINSPKLNDNWYEDFETVYFPETESENLVLKYVKLYRRLKKLIREFNPDLVHSHFITNYSLLALLVGSKKNIITAWGSDVFLFPKKNILNRWIIEYNLKKADRIISTSHVMAKEISLYTTKSVTVIPFGIDFTMFPVKADPQYAPGSEICIGCFKKIESIYAPEILIDAFARSVKKLTEYKLRLIMAGDGSKLDEMKRLAKKLGVDSMIDFLGWVNSGEIPRLMKKIDMCIYLSRNESFGVSLVEAMASKIPLIVTRTPGFIEVIGSNDNALFVDFDNAEETADKITELVLNTSKYHSMTENAYERAFENYQLDKNIDQQVEVYKKVIEGVY